MAVKTLPFRRGWSVLVCGLLAAGCAGKPPPSAEMRAAELAVGEAEEAEARANAPTELQRAREKLARARQAVEDEQMETGRRLAEQALVDAQLAEAKSRAATAEANLQEIQQGMSQLRERSMPSSDTPATGG